MHPLSGALFRLFDADRLLERARRRGDRRLVTAWIRGLGDVASILAEFTQYVHDRLPGVALSLLVRPGLEEACRWIGGVREVIVVPEWSRERTAASAWGLAFPPPWEIRRALLQRGMGRRFDAILPYPLGAWYERTRAGHLPRLTWPETERRFGATFLKQAFGQRPPFVIALNSHIGTSRYYPFDKEWGVARFAGLVAQLLDEFPDSGIVLVDADKLEGLPSGPRIVDARGTLGVSQSVSVIAAADLFVGLDAGPANLVYFMAGVDLDMVVLLGRTDCFVPLRCPPASPGVRLRAVRGTGENIGAITPAAVLEVVREIHARGR